MLQKGTARKAATDLCVPGQGTATSSQVCVCWQGLWPQLASPEIYSFLVSLRAKLNTEKEKKLLKIFAADNNCKIPIITTEQAQMLIF